MIVLMPFLTILSGPLAQDEGPPDRDQGGYISVAPDAALGSFKDKKVRVEGKISQTPWQHMIDLPKTHPVIEYLDLSGGGQTVLYFKEAPGCQGPIVVYGTVVEVQGESKRPGSSVVFTEHHVVVDRWEIPGQAASGSAGPPSPSSSKGGLLPWLCAIPISFVLMWACILYWLRRALRRLSERAKTICQERGEAILMGPESSNYAGATHTYGKVKGNGILCLTQQRILFLKLIGAQIEIPASEVAGASECTRFMGKVSVGSRSKFLVLRKADGNEVGFRLRAPLPWIAAISKVAPFQPQVGM